jgi:hypothetical protein
VSPVEPLLGLELGLEIGSELRLELGLGIDLIRLYVSLISMITALLFNPNPNTNTNSHLS